MPWFAQKNKIDNAFGLTSDFECVDRIGRDIEKSKIAIVGIFLESLDVFFCIRNHWNLICMPFHNIISFSSRDFSHFYLFHKLEENLNV